MELYLTKEKLVYDGSQDLYIGKIGRKRLYCLNDVCRIFGIFFRDTKKNLVENGNYSIGVMIQRKKRYMENTFIDYDGLIEVLLMSRYDSVAFKKWVDSIPETAFKKCQKYVKKTETSTARSIANKNTVTKKSASTASKTVKSKSVESKNTEAKSVESRSVESNLVETNESRVEKGILAFKIDQISNDGIDTSESPTEDAEIDIKGDMIHSICNKERYSVETLVYCLGRLNFCARIAYYNNKLIDFDKAVKHLNWIDDLRRALKRKYGNTPYYRESPSSVRTREEIAKLKEKR